MSSGWSSAMVEIVKRGVWYPRSFHPSEQLQSSPKCVLSFYVKQKVKACDLLCRPAHLPSPFPLRLLLDSIDCLPTSLRNGVHVSLCVDLCSCRLVCLSACVPISFHTCVPTCLQESHQQRRQADKPGYVSISYILS